MPIDYRTTHCGPSVPDLAFHIALCADGAYLPHLGVAAFSLLLNNADKPLALTLVVSGADDADLRRLGSLAELFHVPVDLIELNPAAVAQLGASGHISTASYYRLFLPTLLPDTVERVLYLDCDLVVDGDLQPLLEIDLGDRPLAAAVDRVVELTRREPSGDALDRRYFNTGVLMMDLAQWRRDNLHGRALEYARQAENPLQYADQDALNAVVDDEVRLLEPTWNYMVFTRLRADLQQGLDEAQAGVKRPAVIHFAGVAKPWQSWCGSRYRRRYEDYRSVSPWRSLPYPESPRTVRQAIMAAELATTEDRMREAVGYFRQALAAKQNG